MKTPLQGDRTAAAWADDLERLTSAIRADVRAGLGRVALGERDREAVAEIVGRGVGDTTFAIDEVAERAVDRWLESVARERPLSLLTEETGWRHRGPGSDGSATPLSGFDHGGPRIALDPIDGTRNVMHDIRSAWIVVSFAGPGASAPSFADLTYGLLTEIPDTRGALARELDGSRGGGARVRLRDLGTDAIVREGALRSDEERRLDRGYFPFFGYHPASRPVVQTLCSDVVRRLGDAEPSIDPSTLFDDQYISSAGQLALLALGHYRAIVDARTTVGERTGVATQTAKPYDMAGAALVAQEAGCAVVRLDGDALAFPIDAETPVDFAGFHNAATADAILPHLGAALDALGVRPSRRESD